MTSTRRRRVLTALPLAAALALAACGGGGDDTDATTTVAPSTTVRATTDAPSTTAATTSTTAPATSTTAAPAPTWPLTGQPLADAADITPLRRALVVKIDNHPDAIPQSGLNQTDIVFEENVEGWTRFAAVFHSQGSDPVGPIRSGRTQDINLLESLNKPLLLWSGGNATVTRSINGSELVNLSPSTANGPAGFYRERSRSAPHNLYASTTKAWEAAPEDLSPPTPQFAYSTGATGATGAPAGSLPVAAADLKMEGGLDVSWAYDAASGRFLRSQRGKAQKDSDGNQLSTENLVVVYVDYQPSPADRNSPEAQTIGTGEAFVMFDGTVTHGTWTRADEHSPWSFTDDAGNPILLNPGNTWVELAKQDALSLS
jgi:hypothetical protein